MTTFDTLRLKIYKRCHKASNLRTSIFLEFSCFDKENLKNIESVGSVAVT